MSSQFDLNKLNALIDSATSSIMCDSDCQKNKELNNLTSNYLNAQANLALAEPQLLNAKQSYYTYLSGQDGYNKIVEDDLTTQSEQFVNDFKNIYYSEINKIKSQLTTYNGLLINFRNIIDLYNKYKLENVQLFNQLKNETNDIVTNERKTYYESQQNDYLDIYYTILLVVYTISVIGFVIFIIYTQLNLKVKIILSVLFVFLPFISSYILGNIVYIVYLLLGLLPKNVYSSKYTY